MNLGGALHPRRIIDVDCRAVRDAFPGTDEGSVRKLHTVVEIFRARNPATARRRFRRTARKAHFRWEPRQSCHSRRGAEFSIGHRSRGRSIPGDSVVILCVEGLDAGGAASVVQLAYSCGELGVQGFVGRDELALFGDTFAQSDQQGPLSGRGIG